LRILKIKQNKQLRQQQGAGDTPSNGDTHQAKGETKTSTTVLSLSCIWNAMILSFCGLPVLIMLLYTWFLLVKLVWNFKIRHIFTSDFTITNWFYVCAWSLLHAAHRSYKPTHCSYTYTLFTYFLNIRVYRHLSIIVFTMPTHHQIFCPDTAHIILDESQRKFS
jgi:hypothetical protein